MSLNENMGSFIDIVELACVLEILEVDYWLE